MITLFPAAVMGRLAISTSTLAGIAARSFISNSLDNFLVP